ncbi:E domain-containing protein, partial [Staphylococcus epidermidis]|uniref:E domain-containing protein n=1 Tax=Staphylococcus epidermidis TaxID=1282 RepID=UPI0028CBA424
MRSREEIGFDKKGEFDGKLGGGREKVVEKGEGGRKRIRRGRSKKGLRGEKVGEGEGREKIRKEAVDEMVDYGGEEMKGGDKDEFDGKGGKGREEEVGGKGGVKNGDRGEVVRGGVDDVR